MLAFTFLFFFLVSCATLPLIGSADATFIAAHNRRVLHQPFFPVDSAPPEQPPAPTPPAPGTPFPPSDPNPQPFFPSYPSPPSPTSPASSASYPANISSLSVPQSTKSKSISSKLVATAISAVVAAIFVVAIVVTLHIRKRRRQNCNGPKSYRSDNSSGVFNANAGNPPANNIPKMRRPSQNSSEFLYLGTVVSSHNGIDGHAVTNGRGSGGGTNGRLGKLDSPELHPLPPLGEQSSRRNYRNADASSTGEDEEEFYSPRGSLVGREGSIGTGSISRRAFSAVEVDNFAKRSNGSSCCSSSTSDSGSPVRSVSLTISPPGSSSPRSSRPKSPELVAVQTAPPARSPPPPPPPQFPPIFAVPLAMMSSPSPSPPSSSSPERDLSKSLDSSRRISYISDQNSDSSARSSYSSFRQHQAVSPAPASAPPPPPPPPLSVPPPPPPLGFPAHWESAKTPIPAACQTICRPPVLTTCLKPLTIQTPTAISPMELPPISDIADKNEETLKPKLKPLHWDKVRASSDREMVWDQLKSSSFKLNEEMIETLFVVKTPNLNANEATRRPLLPSSSQEKRVLDPKKSQNIAILLRALHVTTEEVCEALLEGNVETLGSELLESLLKMAPTKEEERKLKEYKDDSPVKLGHAERFLKELIDIPFAFKRVDAMLYVSNFDSEAEYLKKSFGTLEAACEELRNSRMFLKLLEAVLKTGNRMNVGTNRGDAHAFKLDTLLKLVDVKGADGKTTLLHFVVQEIIKSEGARHCGANQGPQSMMNDDAKCRKIGLQVVSGISSELTNVKKAAAMDSDILNGDVLKLSKGLGNVAEVVRQDKAIVPEQGSRSFSESMIRFMQMAEEEIIRIQAQESVALSLVKEITEYFHGNSAKEEAHPFRIFMVVKDFLMILDRVCKEVGLINERTIVSSAHKFPVPVNPTLQQPTFSVFTGKRQYSSSDDDQSSPS